MSDVSAAAKLAQALADIVKNPKIVNEIADIHSKAVQITEDKKKEAEAATLAIEEAKLIQAQLMQDKADHRVYVDSSLKDLERQNSEVANDRESLNRAKSAFQEDVTRVSNHLSASVKEADDRHAKLDMRTADIIQREKTCADIVVSVSKREKIVEVREEKLKEDLAKLAAKKKKLAEAAKED